MSFTWDFHGSLNIMLLSFYLLAPRSSFGIRLSRPGLLTNSKMNSPSRAWELTRRKDDVIIIPGRAQRVPSWQIIIPSSPTRLVLP